MIALTHTQPLAAILLLLVAAAPAANASTSLAAEDARSCGGMIDSNCDVMYLGQPVHCIVYVNRDPQDYDPEIAACLDPL